MKEVYPGGGPGDPMAVPGVRPEIERGTGVTSFALQVEGEVFEVRPGQHGGTDYSWLSGPNPGYGFSLSPTPQMALDEHRENIRGFLAEIDPLTGFLKED
ncbi:hypothetical protein GCM10009841_06130 [Microlunatus panaciterrae]|uniref:Uncharacterized protein n=1 Tax=Microlunatus panaciterrae TaxID=400768 RepID=A0ABS2RJJ0_9ACTN|nr:hypothetical protein [Microlunatus panaciterrae]MBM7798732.1 hypothetical protein [Microlunatus panaciterrae]